MDSGIGRPWTAAYAKGVPADIEMPAASLTDMVEASVRKYRGKTALQFFGADTSYRQLGQQIRRAAEGLRRLGVKPGDRIALVLPNCPQHVIAFYAALRLGAVVVEHNPLYTDRELRHQFEDHGARVAIVWDKAAGRIQKMPDDVGVETVVSVNLTKALPAVKRAALKLPLKKAREAKAELSAKAKNTVPWEKLTAHKPLLKDHPHPAADDLAVLQYTSGTTGSPKGAMLTHRNLLANAQQGRAWVPGLKEGKEVIYGVLPMFHAYGLTLCLTFAMSIGARLVLLPRFDASMVLDAARKHPPTFLPAVPPIYDRLVRAANERGVDLSSVRFAISGAMNLPVATVEQWEEATGGLLVEGYGLTETSPIVLGNPMGPSRKPGTVGVPFPSTEIRIVNPGNPADDVEPGTAGELLVRGPQVFQGYWKRPEETREALLDGGWFRTGDIVSADEDHFITIVDRIKELIITGGFNVSPTEVEDVLLEDGDIAEAAVVGIPRFGGGEEVVAAVVLADDAGLNVEELRAYCRGRLAAYKVPKRIVEIEQMPRSLIGKVLRREVRDKLLADEIQG